MGILAIESKFQRDPLGKLVHSDFWATPAGAEVVARERERLGEAVRRLHGDVVLWVGQQTLSTTPLQRCMTRTCMVGLQTLPDGEAAHEGLCCVDLCALPFKSNSMDGVVLHHALNYADDPRIALREAARVLSPGGRLIICDVNPVSLLGLHQLPKRLLGLVNRRATARKRFVNPLRLFDWLTVLGFDLVDPPEYFGYQLPFQRRLQQPKLEAFANRHLPFGGLLLLQAVKQASAKSPKWRPLAADAKLAPVSYPRVASWRSGEPLLTDADPQR